MFSRRVKRYQGQAGKPTSQARSMATKQSLEELQREDKGHHKDDVHRKLGPDSILTLGTWPLKLLDTNLGKDRKHIKFLLHKQNRGLKSSLG